MSNDPGRVRRLHAAALVGVPLCLAAGGFELWRALQGNGLSWVYAVEWPFVATYAVVIWRQLVREQKGGIRARSGAGDDRGLTHGPGPTHDDPGLRAWQDYVAQLHARQPPGGPPDGR